MKLQDLNGKYIEFGGVYETTYDYNTWRDEPEKATVVYALLDGHVFAFKEDPSDGYRSSCDVEEDVPFPEGARFSMQHSPMKLFAKVGISKDDTEYCDTSFEGLKLFHHEDSEKQVAEFGTSNYDDYYPSYRCSVDVEALNHDPAR